MNLCCARTETEEEKKVEVKMAGNSIFDYGVPSKILDRLYLGSIVPTCREDIETYRITAVLSLLTKKPMDFVHCEGVQYHMIHLDDEEQEDLLSHLERTTLLLEEWLNKSEYTVLVHCQMGVSRSASVIIAYLMWRLQKGYDEVLKFVQKMRPVASPNRGFARQLRLWGQLRWRISLADQWYRRYFFLTIVNLMQKQRQTMDDQLKERIDALANADNVDDDNNSDKKVYRCRRCRCQLFSDVHLLHTDPLTYYVHILSWMTTNKDDDGDSYLKQSGGKISCPKCAGKLGRYCWKPPLRKAHFTSQSFELQVPLVFQMTKSAIDVAQSQGVNIPKNK